MSVFGPVPRSAIGRVFGGGAYSPRSLFNAGEVGAWYDPSDLSTLYQDTAGTTPVTEAGQRVALMLDKSRGLVLGPELVTNGTFDTDTAGWTAFTSSLSAVGGELVITGNGGASFPGARFSFSTVAGRTYRVSGTFRRGTSASAAAVVIKAPGNITAIPQNITTANAPFSFVFVAPTTTATVDLFEYAGSSAGGTVIFDNISVRELPGNHATQSVLAQRPTYEIDANGKPHLFFDGIDDGMVTSTITPGADKVSVFAGVRKLSDANSASFFESGALRHGIFAPRASGAANFGFNSGAVGVAEATTTNIYLAGTNYVVAAIGDIAADSALIRVNGTQNGTSAADQGAGNYNTAVYYIGRRGGTTLPFNGHIYGLIVRFSAANLGASQIAAAERWLAGKTGVTL